MFTFQGEDSIVAVTNILAGQPKQYVDTSTDIEPFITYEYRIIATNLAGNGYSDWSEVTTRPSSKYSRFCLNTFCNSKTLQQ